jgi:GT2 family glycosyltransferase
MGMAGSGSILVGVPVWQGAEFVAATIDSILRQEGTDISVLIAIDGADAASHEVLRPYLSDPRISLVIHPERLGWVGNTAFLFRSAVNRGFEFACIQPHDDIMEPGYLAALARQLADSPSATVVYSDMRIIGSADIIATPPVMGPPVDRLLFMMRAHFAATAYRGLTRVSDMSKVPPISGNAVGDFGVDTVWCARMATVGELIRLPRVLYGKRYHSRNTHRFWFASEPEQRIAAWLRHCLDMLAEALTVAATANQKTSLASAAIERFLQSTPPSAPYRADIAALDTATKRRLFAEFDREAAKIAASVVPRLSSRHGSPQSQIR